MKQMTTPVGHKDVPYRILGGKHDIMTTSDASKERRLQGAKERNFVKREKIKSVAAVKLMTEGEVVGIMFVNYRRRHEFTGAERSLIQLFASSAARFIKHGRELTADPQSKQQLDDAVQSIGSFAAASLAARTRVQGVVVTHALPKPRRVSTSPPASN
jgi:GAF domain-containing protein